MLGAKRMVLGSCAGAVGRGDQFVREAWALLEVLSRSANGEDNRTSSSKKPRSDLDADTLGQVTRQRFKQALSLALTLVEKDFSTPSALENAVREIAEVLIGGTLKFRWWDLRYSPKQYQYVRRLYREFFLWLFDGLHDHQCSPIFLAAWVEWEFNGQIHPYLDCVGKTTLLLSGVVLARAGLPLPAVRSRAEHHSMLDRPLSDFVDYYHTLFPAAAHRANNSSRVWGVTTLTDEGAGIHSYVELASGELIPVRVLSDGLVGVVRSNPRFWRASVRDEFYPLFPILVHAVPVASSRRSYEISLSTSYRYARFPLDVPGLLAALTRAEGEAWHLDNVSEKGAEPLITNGASRLSEEEIGAVLLKAARGVNTSVISRPGYSGKAAGKIDADKLTNSDLLGLLRAHSIPVSFWGTEADSLSLSSLLLELKERVSALSSNFGRLSRTVQLVTLDVFYKKSEEEWYQLIEGEAQQPNVISRGSIRIKCRVDEGQRALLTEFLTSLVGDDIDASSLLLMGRNVRIADSLSYPGLLTHYYENHYGVTVDERVFKVLAPIVAQMGDNLTFSWERLG